MADIETHQHQPAQSLPQAGGGASETLRNVTVIGQTLLPSLKHIFESHAGPDNKWLSSQAETFVQKVQAHDGNSDAAKRFLGREDVDFNSFLEYMTSVDSAITNPLADQDLSWPLASYFISSSHNTYLSGNQLSSDSTTESYTNVLLRGCRCVEVDVWDGDDSDSETSASSSDDKATGETKSKKKIDRVSTAKQKFARLRRNLPDSVANKLDKLSIGEKAEDNAAKHDESCPPNTASDHSSVPVPEVGLNEPRVLHGYTLTKEVSFRDVCVAIKENAFTVTDLPLIISLEVHCNPQQQAVMVKIMKETWDGFLVSEQDGKDNPLPSLDRLRRKILIKVKYTAPEAPSPDDLSGEDDRSGTTKKPKKVSKIIQALSSLGVYTRAVSFKSWTQPESSMPNHIFSLSENKFLDHQEKQGMNLFNHNKQHMVRAYPSGMRISSSNLNPPVFWGYGAQVVALNWQQTDEGMMLNEGMFSGTGGYVLKPEGYRPDFQLAKSPNVIVHKTLDLNLTFLAAQDIPLPPSEKSAKKFKPYFKVELHVEASEKNPHKLAQSGGHEREGEHKARTKTHKGCQLDLQAEKLSFHDIPSLIEELTFVRITVRDDEIGRDDLAAWACMRLDRLGQGYRFIHLTDAKGLLTDGVILVKVEKELRLSPAL